MRNLVIAFIFIFAFNLVFSECVFAQNNVQATPEGVKTPPIPKDNRVLGLSRVTINSTSAKVGDEFCARLVEDLVVNGQDLIPKGSLVCGKVTKIAKAARFRLNKDASITVNMDRIETPNGQKISLAGREIRGVVISPYHESLVKRAIHRSPITISNNATSIPLGRATNLNGGVVYAISQGAGLATGFMSGLAMPDAGRTRMYSAFRRAYEASPIGSAQTILQRGKTAELRVGDGVVMNFDRPTIAKIEEQTAIASR